MPSWRKVIISGSDAALNSLSVTNGITGSLLGTASYAIQELSSSFATSASWAPSSPAFPFTGSAQITGSLNIIGDTTFSGSQLISGSIYFTQASSPSAAGTISRGGYGLIIRGIKGASSAHFMLTNNNGDAVVASPNGTRHMNFVGRVSVGLVEFIGTPPSRLNVVGEGSTSSTITVRVENSAQSASLIILDNQTVGIGRVPTSSLDIAGTTRLSGSFNTAVSGTILTVIGSGSGQPVFTVQGSQGELFSVTDSLSGSLFSVNDISGLPIMEVFSDNTILMGDYQDPMLLTTKKITQTNSGSFIVYSIPTASYDGAFIDYVIKSGSNARAGTIMSTWAGSSIEFTEVDTMDIGSTTSVSLTMILSGSNAVMTGSSATGSWTIRTIIRTI